MNWNCSPVLLQSFAVKVQSSPVLVSETGPEITSYEALYSIYCKNLDNELTLCLSTKDYIHLDNELGI